VGRAIRIATVVLVALVVAALAVVSIRGRDDATRSWSRFCDEAYAIAAVNRSRPAVRSPAARRESLEQVDALAAAAPSAEIEADLHTAAPVLVRPFSSEPLELDSELLAATDTVDSALARHCGVGRSIFDARTSARRPQSAD
jgi:hypothetical protein